MTDFAALAAQFGGSESGKDYGALAAKLGGSPATDDDAPFMDRLAATGKELARQAGLTGRYLVEGAGAVASPINALLGLKSVGSALSDLGVPAPQNETERLVGDVSRGVAGVGLGMGAGGVLAGASGPATAGVGRVLSSNPVAQAVGGASAGGASGLTREAGGNEWWQRAAGLAGGFAAPAAAGTALEVAKAGARGVPQLLQPFTQAGRGQVVGSTLDRMAANPAAARANLQDIPEYVPGSQPTTAQASADPGLLSAERALASANPQFAVRKSSNIAARNRILDEIAGTPEGLKALEGERSATAAENYGAARSDVPKMTPEIRAEIADLQRRPAFQDAVKRAVVSLKNQGEDIATQGKPAAQKYTEVDASRDDIITAIRKLGGINPADEVVGSLAKANPFSADPRNGPVWTAQTKMGSQAALRGHSLDRMAQYLEQYGYPVSSPDDLMDAIAGTTMGKQTFSNGRDMGAVMAAEDPLASALGRLTEQLAVKNAPAAQIDFGANGVKLAHQTKLELDDMIKAAQRSGTDNEVRVLMGVKDKVLGLLEHEDFSPSYRNARQTFAAQSVPINRMEEGQRIQGATRLPGPDVTGEPILSQAKWQNVVTRNLAKLGRTMSPEQVDDLKAIGADLDRASLSDTAGRAAGSNTFQNLSTANVIGAALGGKLANNAIAQSLMRPLAWVYKLPEGQVQDLLAQAMLDPSIARSLMAKARPSNVDFLAAALKDKARAIGIGVTTGAVADR